MIVAYSITVNIPVGINISSDVPEKMMTDTVIDFISKTGTGQGTFDQHLKDLILSREITKHEAEELRAEFNDFMSIIGTRGL